MKLSRSAISLCLLLCAVPMFAQNVPLRNWTVPSTWTDPDRATAMADISHASIFIAMSPCRVADTRNAVGPYGGPILSGGSSRTWDIDASPCTGIPLSGVAAFSLNLTVVNPVASGFITAYPAGGAVPSSATIAWETGPGTIRSNDAIVPGNSSGVSVYAATSVHLVIDINGYYMDGDGMNPGRRFWLYGSIANTFMFVWNQDNSSTEANHASLRAYRSGGQPGVPAFLGEVTASTGTALAILGRNDSVTNNSTAILGISGTAGWTSINNTSAAGVRGRANGAGYSVGVAGEGTGGGVYGFRVNAAGTTQTSGLVGSDGSDGLYTGNSLTVVGTKAFLEPHPAEAGKTIRYIALEGGEAGTYFRGRGRFKGGVAIIDVPEDFRMVSAEEGLTVQVTPIGQTANVAVLDLNLDRITVKSTRDVEFFYTVNGVRDAFRHTQVIEEDLFYFVPDGPDDRLDSKVFDVAFKDRLIANGTYNADGSVNMKTAEAQGWVAAWAAKETARQKYIQNHVAPNPLAGEGVE